MNRRTIVFATSGLALASFAGGAWLYRQQTANEPLSSPAKLGTNPAGSTVGDTGSIKAASALPLGAPYIRPYSPILGPAAGVVTISEFFDPACEACRAFYPILKKIVDAFPGKVRIALRYTAFHGPSKEAIAILEAARKQDKFIPVLEALLSKQFAWAPHGRPGMSPWDFLDDTGLDQERARTDAKDPGIVGVINQDASDAATLGVRQTPTFFVNGKALTKFSGQGLFDLVKQNVEAL